MQSAHRKGIIHRDLKTSNIMLKQEEGEKNDVVVMDFGLARRNDGKDARLTKSGCMLGTLPYLPPELAQGATEEAGPAGDIWSLGVILYELLTGRLPFTAPGPGVLVQIVTEEAPAPSSLRPGLAPALEAVCRKAMAKKPADRYASMKELAGALTDYLAHSEAATTPIAPLPDNKEEILLRKQPATITQPSPVPPARRKRSLASVGICTGIAIVLTLLLASVVVRISTEKGEVTVKTDDDTVELVVKKGGKIVRIRDVKSGQTWNLDADKYTMEQADLPDGLKIELPGREPFRLKRGEKNVVTVERMPKGAAGRQEKSNKDHDRDVAEWVLGMKGSIEIRLGEETRSVSALASLPSKPFRVVRIALWDNPKLRDADFERFRGLSELEWLDVTGAPQLTNACLPSLDGLTKLKRLGLQGNRFTDEAVAHISTLRNLKDLDLSGSELTEDGLRYMVRLDLTRLSISGKGITDDGLRHLKGMKNLELLIVQDSRITDDGLAIVAGFHKLNELWLGGPTEVSGRFLADLKDKKSLDSLLLAGTGLTDDSVTNLTNMEINALDLRDTAVTDKSMPVLAKVVRRYLGLAKTGITNKGLEGLKGLRATSLDVSETAVTNEGLKPLRRMPLLDLNLNGTKITDEAVEELKKITTLKSLYLKSTKMTVVGVKKLREELPKCDIQADE